MSSFTIPLKKVIELTGGTTEVVNGMTILTGGNIGLAHYPIFDEEYRPVLTGLIVDRYWNREIGLETVDMFQLAMRRKMNEIMPYYNKLYETERIAYDPLSTISIKTVSLGTARQTGESVSSGTANSLTDSESRAVTSETPQTMLSGSGDYATSAADSKGKSVNDSTSDQTANEQSETENETDSETTGYQGVASDLIMRYRESLMNINVVILDELDELFMGIWDTADSFTNSERYFF